MDSYQPIYDATRSRISNGDIGRAVESALHAMNISHYASQAGYAVQSAAAQYERPSAVYRPTIGMDGTKWCALYGDDLVHGISGFGDTPAEAMADFDNNWNTQRTPAAVRLAKETA